MPGTELGKAYVQIVPSATGISDGIKGVLDEPLTKEGHAGGKKLGAGIATGLKAASAAIIAGTTALTAAITKGVADTAAYGDNVDKMSQKMGLSAEAYQEWDAIMQHSGTSIESLQSGMKTLANAVENGNGAFERLGITQEQIAGMNNEQLFSATITALQNVDNETERTYLAGQLLGRGATELGALLNTSAEDTEAMRRRVHELGGVMSNDAVKAAAAYQDSLQDMKTALSGASRNIMSEFMPSITTVMNGLTELFAGGDGIGLINDGVTDFVNKLAENTPKILEVGGNIVVSLANAIIQNLPALISAAIPVLQSLVSTIIENLPMIIDAALDVVLALANGIIDAAPKLIPALVNVIMTIADKLTEPDTLVMLIDAALQLILALADGLVNAIPSIIERIPTIIINITKALIRAAPKIVAAGFQLLLALGRGLVSGITSLGRSLWEVTSTIREKISGLAHSALQWGKDMIDNFVQGIKNKVTAVTNAVKDVANKVKGFLGFSEPDEGPLSNFHTYAPDMLKLFAQGIRDNEHLITDQIGKSFDFGNDIVDMNISTSSGFVNGVGTNNTFGAVSISIYPQEGQSADDIADAVMYRIQEATERRSAALA